MEVNRMRATCTHRHGNLNILLLSGSGCSLGEGSFIIIITCMMSVYHLCQGIGTQTVKVLLRFV